MLAVRSQRRFFWQLLCSMSQGLGIPNRVDPRPNVWQTDVFSGKGFWSCDGSL
jgi:hypothetical protein